MSIPQIAALKDIPIGFKYYIPFTTENLRIEPEVDNPASNQKGFRIWVNLNAKASIKKYSIFSLPVIKKKGKLVVRFEFFEESYVNILNFLINFWENEKFHTSLNEVRNELNKKNSEKEFALFYSGGFSSYIERSVHTLQQSLGETPDESQLAKFQELRKIAQQVLLNFKEEEMLSMQDFSQIRFNFRQTSASDLTKIISYLSEVGLSQEQEEKIYSYLEINRLIDGMPLQKEGKHGVLLYGPPGTGKTTTMSAFFKVFELLGCSVFEVNAQSLTSRPQVGAFAAEISKQIFEPAIEKIIKKQMPCLVYVDEATNLVSKPRESGVADWYQEGLDTLKNYMNRSKFPGIILCLATNAKISDLDGTIVGDDGRLEAVYFDFLNANQFQVLWKAKLKSNLNLNDDIIKIWFDNAYIEKLSKICSNSVSGRFVANFCSKYREIYLSDKKFSGMLGLKFRRDTGKNLTKENDTKEIAFVDFYENFLIKLKIRIKEEEKSGIEEIKKDHYFTIEERDSRIAELESKNANKLREIEEELKNLHSGEVDGDFSGSSGDLDNNTQTNNNAQHNNTEIHTQIEKEIHEAYSFITLNLPVLRSSKDKSLFSSYLKNLIYISENLAKYREIKLLSKLDYKKLAEGFNFCFQILGKHAGMREISILDQREFAIIERFVETLKSYHFE